MNNHYEMNDQNLDNRLADFVDELLEGKGGESPAGQEIDLEALQDTVIKLKKALADDLPSAEMSERIQQNLAAEWGKQHTAVKVKAKTSPVENWRKLFRDRFNLPSLSSPRTFAVSFVTVAVLVVAALLLLDPDVNSNIAGTALGQASWIPAAVIVAGVAALGLIWFFRSRR